MRTITLALATTLIATPLLAQGWIEPLPDHARRFGVTKVRTTVSARVTGRVALVEVEEWFRNDGRAMDEGDYLYPLPGEAVFSNFSLFQGDQELRGETMDAAKARAIYEEIVRRKRDPALIELAGHGLVRARVFPINPGETRKITLRYTQMLARAGDALQFRYAAGGRYGPQPAQAGGDGGGLRGQAEPAPLTFVLTADSAGVFGEPFSPTHAVRATRNDGRLTVRPEGELRGDFALFLPLARRVVGLTIVTHRPAGEDGYFMLMLTPGRADGMTLPRDVTVVLDVSGSMSGSKLEQAKAALLQLLASFGTRDRFRLVSFSNGVSVHSPGWSSPTNEVLGGARRWVAALNAEGGTNVAGALEEAFRLESPEGRLPIVVFLTDGLPSVGEQDPERLAHAAEERRGRARVFAFGVGHDVNTYLLDRLTTAARGATAYVEPGEDVERALGTLSAKIQYPVLADLALRDGGIRLSEIHPTPLPDLFAGEELVVFGRYRLDGGTEQSTVTVTGVRNGQTETYTIQTEFPEHAPGNDYIPRLWASRKIGALAREIRLHGANPELEDEIRRTALRYGLLSEYTSYLVQEPMDAPLIGPGIARPDARPLGGVMQRSAPAERQTGAGAVAAAKQDRARLDTRTTVELAAADEALLARGDMGQARHVAGRLFKEIEGVWVDLRHGDSLRVVAVAPFSPAYFAVLDALPELRPYLVEFAQVLVTGERASVRAANGGATTLTVRDLERLVRDFRAR